MKSSWVDKLLSNKDIDILFLSQALPFPHLQIWEYKKTHNDIAKIMKPCIAREIWQAWAEFNYYEPKSSHDVLKQTLWFNSQIIHEGKPYINKARYEANIVKIEHVYIVKEKRFYTYREICNNLNYNGTIPFLHYTYLIRSIPREWKHMLNEYPLGTPLLTGIQKIRDIIRPSGLIYENILNKQYKCEQTARIIWATELNVETSEEFWARLYPTTLRLTKSTCLRYFQYSLLHKRLTMNIHGHKWNVEISPLCSFCSQPDETVLHLLWECSNSKPILKFYKGSSSIC